MKTQTSTRTSELKRRRKTLVRGKVKAREIRCKYFRDKYLKRHNKTNSQLYLRPEDFNRVFDTYWDTFADIITHSSEGFFIEEFGYFGILEEVMPQVAKAYKNGEEVDCLNPHTLGRVYSINFIPLDSKNILTTFSMDSAFHQTRVNSVLAKKLKEGKKYRFNATLFYKNNHKV